MGEISIIPHKQEPPTHHFIHIDVDYAGVEARMMATLCDKCPVCGETVFRECMTQHCRKKNDYAHLVMEVMGS